MASGAPDLPRRFRYSSRHSRSYRLLAVGRSPTAHLGLAASAGRLLPQFSARDYSNSELLRTL